MTRDDIRRLMGGYATGTLGEAERKALFEAALEDQELFDELAGEQALKEVLDQPGAKQRLIAALAPRKRSFWSRNWTWAIAAGVAAGAFAFVVWHNEEPELQEVAQSVPEARPQPRAFVPVPQTPPPQPVVPAPKPLPAERRDLPALPPPAFQGPPPAEVNQPARQQAADAVQLQENLRDAAPTPPAEEALKKKTEAGSKTEAAADSASKPAAVKQEPAPAVAAAPPAPAAPAAAPGGAPGAAPQTAQAFGAIGGRLAQNKAAGAGGGGGRGGARGGRGGRALDAGAATTANGVAAKTAVAGFGFDYSITPERRLRVVPTGSGYLTITLSDGSTPVSARAVSPGVATEIPLPDAATTANVVFAVQAANAVVRPPAGPTDTAPGTKIDPTPSPDSRLQAIVPVPARP